MSLPLSVVITLLLSCIGLTLNASQKVKVIAHGWDILAVQPHQLLENADQLNRMPIDGVIVNVSGQTDDGKKLSHKNIAYGSRWKFEYFSHLIPTLKEVVKQPSLRHSFAGAWIGNTWRNDDSANRKRWDDDAAWDVFANNLGVLTRIVRESGLEGIIIDNEDYSKIKQYFWQESDGDYEEVRKLARKRGREVFGAAFREKADLKIMAFWFLSWPFAYNYLTSDDPDAMRRKSGDLWPDFVNGMLDVMPDSARFIDGCETTYGDRADRDDAFRKAKALLNNVLPLIEPENHVAYRGKMLFAPAQYLDSYTITNKSSIYYMPPMEKGSRLDRFAENLCQTVSSSDGYIWLYGERYSYIKWRGVKLKRCSEKTWDEMLPGFNATVGSYRNAGAFGTRRFDEWNESGAIPVNLFKNGSCEIKNIPKGGGLVTNRFTHGLFSWKGSEQGVIGTDTSCGRGDCFSVCLDKVKKGGIMVKIDDVKPGERYVVRVFARGLNPRGAAYFRNGYPSFPFEFGEVSDNGWRVGYSYVVVPSGMKILNVMFSGSENETLWYDDIGIYADGHN